MEEGTRLSTVSNFRSWMGIKVDERTVVGTEFEEVEWEDGFEVETW